MVILLVFILHLWSFNFQSSANDLETQGVWLHTSTDEDVTFFGSKAFSCHFGGDSFGPKGGHALAMAFEKDPRFNGRWCDHQTNSNYNYICKALL